MANYHLSIKVFSRGKGASAVAKAAYRAAEWLYCERTGITSDYTNKRGVVHKEILLPARAPPEYKDRETLWNAVEDSEANKNAQLAREIEISLPVELTRAQNIALAREYVHRQFVDKGMCADLCVHDVDGTNPHVHIMLTMRPFDENGKWAAKSRKEYILDEHGEKIMLPSGEFKIRKVNTVDWNDRGKAEEWRKAWADAQNAVLEKHNLSVRVDHRSYKRQGKEQIPTVHLGVAASQMERKGIRTERGDINREIAVSNREMSSLRARIRKAEQWIYSQPLQDMPGIADILFPINSALNMQSRWKQIAHLKQSAEVLVFLQQNKIGSMEQLVSVITNIHNRQRDLADGIKAKERRINDLRKHLENVETRKRHSAIYKKYISIDPKKRQPFYDKHADRIEQYEAADKYLKAHLNGYGKITEKKWRDELKELLSARLRQVEDYYKLKDEIKQVERLQRSADAIINGITPERAAQRSYDLSLCLS